jgi:four helix bundle protein
VDKSYAFSLEIIKLYKNLSSKNEYVLSKQILRSGTSIGANVEEAQAAFSKKDFIHKMSISSKEARETLYWLRLLSDSEMLDKEFNSLLSMAEELIKLLTSIVKSSQQN